MLGNQSVAFPYVDKNYIDNFKWFHFTCRIKSDDDSSKIITAYMNTVILDNKDGEVDLSEFNPQAREIFNLRLGKSLAGRNALPKMQLKEVRLWNSFRTDE